MKLRLGLSSRCSASMSKREFMKKISTTAMTTFTAGPASATTISWPGCSGMRSSRASPPIGRSVMSGVLDAVAARRERMAEFVRHDAGEEGEDEGDPLDGRLRSALLVVGDGDPGEEQQERDVDADFGAEQPADGK